MEVRGAPRHGRTVLVLVDQHRVRTRRRGPRRSAPVQGTGAMTSPAQTDHGRGSPLAPHTKTTTRSPGDGSKAPAERRQRRGAPGLGDQVQLSPHARCASRIAASVTEHDTVRRGPRRASGERDVADPAGPERVGRDRPDLHLDGFALRHGVWRREQRRARPRSPRPRFANHDATPPISPPPPTRDEHRVGVGHLLGDLERRSCPDRPRPRAGRRDASRRCHRSASLAPTAAAASS